MRKLLAISLVLLLVSQTVRSGNIVSNDQDRAALVGGVLVVVGAAVYHHLNRSSSLPSSPGVRSVPVASPVVEQSQAAAAEVPAPSSDDPVNLRPRLSRSWSTEALPTTAEVSRGVVTRKHKRTPSSTNGKESLREKSLHILREKNSDFDQHNN